ncbi:hypothetical protein HU200_051033 [Digitaria exilis]|uniref:Uncharacterized protein n=1 Tax=Digitaria exilis TaxID=1010633 RepID=A0A835ATF5_9POAL|nr:hypothetical protein HU200_051033 [Digitaria exilis]
MYVIGIVRYGERARALWRANLDNIKPQDSSGSADTEETIKMKDDIVASRIRRRLERKDLNDDGEALLLAQDLFPLWQHDMPWSIPLSTPDCPASNGVEHHVQGGGDGALSHVRAPLYIPRRTSRIGLPSPPVSARWKQNMAPPPSLRRPHGGPAVVDVRPRPDPAQKDMVGHHRLCQCPPSWLAAVCGDRLKEIRYLSKLPIGVKRLLFERVQVILRSDIDTPPTASGDKDSYYTMEDIRTYWGHKALRQMRFKLLLELVFNVWVDKLVYAGVRCARESHAKQLSAGGDLTTVVWMVVQHAGPFQVGREKFDDDDYKKKPPPVSSPEAKPE